VLLSASAISFNLAPLLAAQQLKMVYTCLLPQLYWERARMHIMLRRIKRMQLQYKTLSFIAGTLLVLGITGGCAFAQQPAPHAPTTIGVVDRDKIVASYPRAQQAAEELKKSEDKIHRLIEDSNKQYEEAKAAKKPPAELEGLQKRLQNQIDDEVKRVQARAQALENDLESAIDTAIKAESAARKVDIVFLKQAVLSGGTDLTEGIVKRLNSVASTSAGKSTSK
jgi:Skp family chaperone for outer membrane proteins